MSLKTRLRAAWNGLRGKPVRKYAALWQGAETNRLFADWIATALTPDEEIRWSIRRLRDRARELARNNPLVRQYLNLIAMNVIGPNGIALQAQVKNNDRMTNKSLSNRIESAWADWSRQPTLDGRLTLVQLEQLLAKTVARDGEVFVRLWRGSGRPYGLALEVIDADMLDEEYNVAVASDRNEIRMGVELDGDARPIAYWFWTDPPSSQVIGTRRRVRVPAEDVLHLYDMDRIHQSRGIPWVATVMGDIKMLDGYEEAALVSARIGAAQSMWWVRQEGDASGTPPPADKDNRIFADMEPGQQGFAPEGYRPEVVSPAYPHTSYAEFVKAAKRRISTGLGVSYNNLCNDLEGVNYSSIRAGLLVERDFWRCKQNWWIDAFLEPVYREFLSLALLTGDLKLDSRDPRKFQSVRWSPRGFAWVDPMNDTEAGVLGIQNGLTSRTKLLAEQGLDRDDIFQDLADEKKAAAEMGVEIQAPAPEKAKAVDKSDAMRNGGSPKGESANRLEGIIHGGRTW